MSIGVNFSINVSKIDKSKLIKGEKGVYLDMTCFINDVDDQYGNRGMITQSVSKEDRSVGVRGEILGNARVFFNDAQQAPNQQQQAPTQQPATSAGIPADLNQDIPF